jgi:hypothetical protein
VHFLQFANYTPKKCTVFSLYIHYFSTPTYVSARKLLYEPPEDGLVKAETYVGVEEE